MSGEAVVGGEQVGGASVAGPGAVGHGATNVPLSCAACRALAVLLPDARGFRCRSCGADNTFFECTHCHAASIAATQHGQPTTKWDCQSCRRTSQVPLFGRLPVQTARDVMATFELNGVDLVGHKHPLLGGFVTVASTRPTLQVGSICTVGVLDAGVSVRVADGTSGETFAYEDLTVLAVSGRGSQRAATGAGRDARGGAALASLLGTGQRQGLDSVLRIATAFDSLVLRHPKHTREQLRRVFAGMMVLWQARRQPAQTVPGVSFDDAVGELERLTRLHAGGGLTDAEFVALRALIVRGLSAHAA